MTNAPPHASIEDDEPDYSDFTDAENLKYLRHLERLGLAVSSPAPDGLILWEMTEQGLRLQAMNKLPDAAFVDVLH
jgi:hypothetical protein